MCFFAILGVVPKERVIQRQMQFCRMCGHDTMHETVESRQWFTLFFVPLFPVSAKRTYTRCSECGLTII